MCAVLTRRRAQVLEKTFSEAEVQKKKKKMESKADQYKKATFIAICSKRQVTVTPCSYELILFMHSIGKSMFEIGAALHNICKHWPSKHTLQPCLSAKHSFLLKQFWVYPSQTQCAID